MEKRREKTGTRTLRFASVCAKAALIAVLFAPSILTARYALPRPLSEQSIHPSSRPVDHARTKKLVKIYSIMKANRPGMEDKEAWQLSTVSFEECASRDLDPMLVLAVIKVESGFRNRALSPVGARGLMQIMPETGKFLTEELLRAGAVEARGFVPDHLDDPVLNIKLGVYYLVGLKRQFRNLSLALLAYNLGPSEMHNRLENDVKFSDQYAAAVLTAYREYKNDPF
jgi:hypothetical protein